MTLPQVILALPYILLEPLRPSGIHCEIGFSTRLLQGDQLQSCIRDKCCFCHDAQKNMLEPINRRHRLQWDRNASASPVIHTAEEATNSPFTQWQPRRMVLVLVRSGLVAKREALLVDAVNRAGFS